MTTDIQLTAKTPVEMLTAQAGLVEWVDKKLTELTQDAKDLKESYEHAKKNKWRTTTLYNHHLKAVKRLTFYEKMKAALLAGYYIVPNFPVQMFVIRTSKDNPSRMYAYDTTSWNSDKKQSASELVIGNGKYQNPFPVVYQQTIIDSEGKKHNSTWASDWAELDFPISMAKPDIMEATSQAMALKIFDEIGVFPATKKEDPVIIGRILHTVGYKTKIVSFMIAWHLDTKVL